MWYSSACRKAEKKRRGHWLCCGGGSGAVGQWLVAGLHGAMAAQCTLRAIRVLAGVMGDELMMVA